MPAAIAAAGPSTTLPAPSPLYFVECDFGRIGRAFIECDRDRSSLDQVVADIAAGQIERPLVVLEVIEAEKSCRDVTEDVARDVYALLARQGHGCPPRLRDFIDQHVGLSEADRLDAGAGLLEQV
jgi:hypothetical protein